MKKNGHYGLSTVMLLCFICNSSNKKDADVYKNTAHFNSLLIDKHG